jgi:hypothetical protein
MEGLGIQGLEKRAGIRRLRIKEWRDWEYWDWGKGQELGDCE